MPQPSAVISVPTSADESILSKRARSTFRILPFKRQDRLRASVAALLGGAAGRITLDDEELGQRRILLLAVGELARQTRDVERAFAARQLARLARGLACAGRVDDLRHHGLGLGRRFEQELRELLGDERLDDALHFGRDELVLGLRGKLRIGQLDREHRRQPFARVVPGRRHAVLAVGELALDVVVQRPGKPAAEPRQVGATVLLRDVVGVAVHRFLVRIVPLHGKFDDDAVTFGTKPDARLVNRGLAAVEIANELADPALVVKGLLLLVALVNQFDSYARV